MKKISKILSAGLLSVIAVSCNDWIDDTKQTQFPFDYVVFEDETTTDAYVLGFYTYVFKYSPFNTAVFGGAMTESLADAMKYGSTAMGNMANFQYLYATDYNYVTPERSGYDCWGTAYEQIRRMNQFIVLMKQYSRYDAEKQNRWEAETRLHRAFVYFQLAKRHPEGVIVYSELPPSDGQQPRATAEETWKFIIDDLQYAIDNLPEKWNTANTGRVTKPMAYAMMSRAALYAGDYLNSQEYYQKAYDAAEACDKYGYKLTTDYAQAWKGSNSESILEFQFNQADPVKGPSHQFDRWYVPACDGYPSGALGTPTQELVECYENKDGQKVDWTPWHSENVTTTPPWDQLEPRFAATVMYQGCQWKGHVMDCSVGGQYGEFKPYGLNSYSYGYTTTGYFLRKLLDESNTDVSGRASSQTWVEIRYAEVLLNKAEAAMRLGKTTEANAALDKVRARVGLGSKSSLSGEDWWAAYRNERKVELMYEGHLFWDMRRWNRAHLDYNNGAGGYNNFRVHGIKIENGTYSYIECDKDTRVFNEKTYNLPIPAGEVRNNRACTQYPEWL